MVGPPAGQFENKERAERAEKHAPQSKPPGSLATKLYQSGEVVLVQKRIDHSHKPVRFPSARADFGVVRREIIRMTGIVFEPASDLDEVIIVDEESAVEEGPSEQQREKKYAQPFTNKGHGRLFSLSLKKTKRS